MARDDLIKVEGVVQREHKGGIFSVLLDSDQEISAKLCGKMRKHRIKVLQGDRVEVGVSPYDPTNGIILFRHK